ncbi:MAG: ATP-dependent helicase [Anaerolineae bacterium]|nr:ATP-dependent helicase [Anaerolineae bacterium]
MPQPELRLRPEQAAIVEGYAGGKIGIAAVPGSGKTFTLSRLAARLVEQLIAEGQADGIDRQEVLIVTFTNSAVNSFRSRIASILAQERGLLPYIGYRVRTLHGLAHDIVRERPALVGLAEDFQIVDERVSAAIIRDIAHSVLPDYFDIFRAYVNPDAVASDRQLQRFESKQLPDLAVDIAMRFIKHAKDNLLDVVRLREALTQAANDLPLAHFGLSVYEDYQRSLSYRGAVDFDDLVRYAILALRGDRKYRERLQRLWPFVLEDEAQDSSSMQEQMLRLLSAERNWVRVGDPNQAINTTFTTADPRFLRDFLVEPGVTAMPLRTSGRSAQPIIALANTLVQWTSRHHPALPVRKDALDGENLIEPTPLGDPQPNPPARESQVHIHYEPGKTATPERELDTVADNIERYLRENDDCTVAVLAPTNSRAYKLAEMLKARGVPYDDSLLRSSSETRETAGKLFYTLDYLGNPLNVRALGRLYRDVWWSSGHRTLSEDDERQEIILRALAGCRQIEQFMWPVAGHDWLDTVDALAEHGDVLADLAAFRRLVRTWLQGVILPVDQLVLTITQDLFVDAADIALGHKIAGVLRGFAQSNPDWRLPEFAEELRLISENQRRFIGFEDVERGYEAQPGQVTVATMHAAKGLEWDRVYLMGVNNHSFPSVQEYDEYIAEKWFIRDNLNLEAEALAQLDALRDETAGSYREGVASEQARRDYAAERLRLLYVGITRARHDVIILWNMGRFWQRGGTAVKQPALPVVALWEYLEGTLQV